MQRIFSTLMLSLLATVITAPLAVAQAAPQTQTANQTNPFKTEELEQLVAPIALYPDALMAQVLMASTYPLEVVSAARWSKANPNVKDKDLDRAMQQQPWDASVKSLTAFPQVLAMMNEKLDWTQKLGDAFLAQQGDVMDATQRLRLRAQTEGNLKSSKEQVVTVNGAGSSTIIIIEPATPQTVYVPVYNPVYVYGAWPYPYYMPYYYYPPYYAYPSNVFSFTMGVFVGAALWGGFDWHHHDVNININHYNRFNHTNINNGNWKHNVDHRRGVQYRDAATQQRFNKAARPGIENREAFRGRADEARKELNGMDKSQVRDQIQNVDRDKVNDKLQNVDREQVRDKANKVDKSQLSNKAKNVDHSKVQDRAQKMDRPNVDRANRADKIQPRDNAFRDIDRGNAARAASARGNQSFSGMRLHHGR